MTRYFKVLGKNRQPIHGGAGQWPYRKWTDPIENIKPCVRGYHIVEAHQITPLLPADCEIWEVEAGEQIITQGDKSVTDRARLVKKMRWDDRIARLFAADCAEHVLHLVPEQDRGPFVESIRVARMYANGEASRAELAAARAAAWDAARAAAGGAERQWQGQRLVEYLDGART